MGKTAWAVINTFASIFIFSEVYSIKLTVVCTAVITDFQMRIRCRGCDGLNVGVEKTKISNLFQLLACSDAIEGFFLMFIMCANLKLAVHERTVINFLCVKECCGVEKYHTFVILILS